MRTCSIGLSGLYRPTIRLFSRLRQLIYFSADVGLAVYFLVDIRLRNFRLRFTWIVSYSCCYQLRQLRSIRRSLTLDAAHSLIHAFIHSRVDYCNAILVWCQRWRHPEVAICIACCCPGFEPATYTDPESGTLSTQPPRLNSAMSSMSLIGYTNEFSIDMIIK